MEDGRSQQQVIRGRFRRMALVYGAIIVVLIVIAVMTQSPGVIIGVSIASVGLVALVFLNERNSRRS